MHNLLNTQGELYSDNWQLDDDALPSGDQSNKILPLAWLLDQDQDLSQTVAVSLPNVCSHEILGKLTGAKLIAIEFPKFVDGRGYSLARILRDDFHYTGDIRAIGDIRCDQLAQLLGSGFSSFALKADQDISLARNALIPLHTRLVVGTKQAAAVFDKT